MAKGLDSGFTAYNVKTGEKEVKIYDATISKTKRGAYIVKGVAEDGSKLARITTEEKAMDAIKNNKAKKDF